MTSLVDTSFLFALINRNDRSHTECAAVAQMLRPPLIVPVTVLPEVAYLLDSRLGHHIMRQFVQQMTHAAWTLEAPSQDDLERSFTILEQYSDNQLDFVDSTIVAIAERMNIQRILTLDRRHFYAIQPTHCLAFELLP